MNRITLCPAGPDDSEFAYSVRRSAFKNYAEQVGGWDDREQRRLHEQRFRTQDFRIIRLADVDVGVVAITISPDAMNLHQLFLLPDYQGRGLGRECMELLMEEAHRLVVPVRLRVLKVNRRAFVFFQRLGFTCAGETETHFLMEGIS